MPVSNLISSGTQTSGSGNNSFGFQGGGGTVSGVPVLTDTPVQSGNSQNTGGGSSGGSVSTEPEIPRQSLQFTPPGTTNGTTASPNDPITSLLASLLGPGATDSGQPAQITTVAPPTTGAPSMTKTWMIVLGLALVGGIAWYVMKKKKATTAAS